MEEIFCDLVKISRSILQEVVPDHISNDDDEYRSDHDGHGNSNDDGSDDFDYNYEHWWSQPWPRGIPCTPSQFFFVGFPLGELLPAHVLAMHSCIAIILCVCDQKMKVPIVLFHSFNLDMQGFEDLPTYSILVGTGMLMISSEGSHVIVNAQRIWQMLIVLGFSDTLASYRARVLDLAMGNERLDINYLCLAETLHVRFLHGLGSNVHCFLLSNNQNKIKIYMQLTR
ncbi:hypothetical protein L6452_19700 [Arctium lappa]|uniref:Uncharacterized protein n=1 Tax=Arctium lappa TaxID=4217 RepID=A0ACB9BAK5_ARCLA|nr:hypothetical protein L6452_19700 [Arctium lappa]